MLDLISKLVEDFKVVPTFLTHKRNINSRHNKVEKASLECFSLQDSFQKCQSKYIHGMF